MSTDRHEGGCLCGAIRFEVDGKPKWVAHCHCHSCRRNTGAPIATYAGFDTGQFRWSKGEPAGYHSSPEVTRSFCSTCGTPLTFASEKWADEIHIHISTLDQPEDFPPKGHVFFEEHIPWFEFEDGLKRFPRTSSG